ncbi:MAG: hypothetical protein ACRDUX_01700 [Mycobacterium sp.]
MPRNEAGRVIGMLLHVINEFPFPDATGERVQELPRAGRRGGFDATAIGLSES